MASHSAFRAANFAVVRLSALSERHGPPQPPYELTALAEVRSYLEAVAMDPALREAIAVSSSSLDAALSRILANPETEPAKLQRAALSTMRYMSRMTHRPTPFGLMAGVTTAQFSAEPKVRMGTDHRKHARADMGWLVEVIRDWETEPETLSRLRVVANDLSFVRGDRLVLGQVRDDENAPLLPDDRERTVRHTRAVRTALTLARTPISYTELVEEVVAAFPDAERAAVQRMLTTLVEQEFLLTDLRPPLTSADPLQHVLDLLPGRLTGIRDALADYAASPIGDGHPAWRTATAAMRALKVSDHLVQVDLEMDADIVLPTEVATEVERAATVAWRLAPDRDAPLSDYQAEFIERYGVGAWVPIKELLDPQLGLGPPADYLQPPGHRRRGRHIAREDPERDLLLGGLAQRGLREVCLDDDLVERLARRDTDERPPTYLEMCVHLFADSEDDLRSGRFRLVAAPSQFTRPGPLAGRFLHFLNGLETAVADVANKAVEHRPVQVITSPARSRLHNLVQIPRLTAETIQVGVFAERSEPGVLSLDDIAVCADLERFFVLSTRTGEEVVPQAFHALNSRLALPNAVRLLLEIGESQTPPWPLWNWGSAERLPYLPRVSYGRTVLSPARWLLDPELYNAGAEPYGAGRKLNGAGRELYGGKHDWERAFEQWRDVWSVPDIVYAVQADRRVRLDLSSPAQSRLLRDDLRKGRGVVLQEEPLGGQASTGWVHGHANELAIPLLPAPAPRRVPATVRPRGRAIRLTHPPGGEWLYVKIYAERGRHSELLTRHLPELIGRTAHLTDRWFFLRYHDDRPHLRLRFHGLPDVLNAELLPAVHQWSCALAAGGVIGDVQVDTYRPEVLRYGGPAAIDAAERAFAADTESVLEQFRLRSQGQLDVPLEILTAANFLDLASQLHGDGWQRWFLETFPKGAYHAAFQQNRRLAVRLLDPHAEWKEIPVPLLESWRRRAHAVSAYGQLVKGIADTHSESFAGVLHMHHNRLVGIDPTAEQASYAIARGALQAHLDRARNIRS